MQQQQQAVKNFAHDGYGLPGQAKFGGMNPVVAQRMKLAQRQRAMALALARQQPMGRGMRGGGGQMARNMGVSLVFCVKMMLKK